MEVFGRENLPKENGYVMYSNHEGFFDGLALIAAMDEPFHFLVMKEMKEFPFVKYVLSMIQTIYMDREDPRDSVKAIRECARFAESRENVVIFPEGTLEREENHMLPYKPGAFKAASMARAAIVPVVLKDSFRPFDRPGCRKCTVEVHILEPYAYDSYKECKSVEIAEKIQKRSEKILYRSK